MGKIKAYFIPCSENCYAPNSLQVHAVRIMAVLVFISFALTSVQSVLWTKSDWLVGSVLPSVIVELTNDERSNVGSLSRNAVLDRAAQLKAEHMAAHEYFSHYSPDGVSPWHWFDQVGYSFVHAGENLAIHFMDSDDVVDAWMDSPGHRANILNEDFTEIGVGTAKGSYNGVETLFVVQLFGAPAAPVSQTVAVQTDTATAQDSVAPILGADASTEIERESTYAVLDAFAQYHEGTEEEVQEPVIPELITTSNPLAEPAIVEPQMAASDEAGVVAQTLTQPGNVLQILYGVLSLFVIMLLMLSIVIEWRKQNPIQIAYGAGLLAAMGALFYIHVSLTGTGIIV
ncbi:CAP domain-containing protein [Candidatus Kaiserbacteria bacterium]|nr:CAP domain-containing protein [Candidatus Kaiserbacteria bacterium]